MNAAIGITPYLQMGMNHVTDRRLLSVIDAILDDVGNDRLTDEHLVEFRNNCYYDGRRDLEVVVYNEQQWLAINSAIAAIIDPVSGHTPGWGGRIRAYLYRSLLRLGLKGRWPATWLGITASDNSPVTCPSCGCMEFVEEVTDSIAGHACEIESSCACCNGLVGVWAYGYWLP